MSAVNNLRLTSIELNGYKTFASRTLFEFAGPVTAIVGPNGSGKSNIADALRWVLGEQSYGVLRGRKTEDMIFSGSESRPRSGMASVTITFDNSQHWLPIDFSEVSVTRRAYRDGNNEYLINSQKVRLKDVTELLSQSALAERTYTVIGQGLVDTALTLKSDERRRLFEEAAGIGLYRTRKDQALRRLDATTRNLERVEDILAELRPRVRSLGRQAARAEEYSRLRADLRATLRQWYGYHWHRAQANLRELRQAAHRHEEELGVSRQKQTELSAEVNQLRERTQELRVQLNEWHRRLAELHAGRENAAKTLAVADERQRALAERREALKDEKQRIEQELEARGAQLAEAQRDTDHFRTEAEEAAGHLEEARSILSERQAAQEQNASQVDAAKQLLSSLERQQSGLTGQRDQAEDKINRSQSELAELQHTLAAVETDLAELKTKAQESDAQVAEADKALESAQEQRKSAEDELEKGKQDLVALENRLRQLEGKQTGLAAEIKALEDADRQAAGFARGARLLLDAARDQRLSIKPGTLGRELQVPTEVEAAIAAALGNYVDAVIADQNQAAEEVLSLLEQEGASGALVSSAESGNRRMQVSHDARLLGVAADLVEAPDELQPVVNLLLGRVLVVRERSDARRTLDENQEATAVVTLKGEVFYRSGLIEVRTAKGSTALARPRQERDLQQQLSQTAQEIANIQSQLERQQSGLSELEDKLAAAQEAVAQAAGVAEAQKQGKQSNSLEIQQMERQIDWFRTQQRTLEAEQDKAKAQLENVGQDEGILAAKLADAKTALEEQLGSTVDIPLDEQHAQVAHWEMRMAVAQRALQEAERRVQERQQALQRAEAQMTAQQERSQELEDQVKAIAEEVSLLGSSEGSVDTEIADIQARIGPAEDSLTETEGKLGLLQVSESQAMQAVSTAERAHTQAQIALGRQQESLESLRNRIEDDFGLVAFQYEAGVSGPTPLPLGELVEQLPVVEELALDLEEILKQQRAQIRRLGSVNPEAEEEYVQVKERVESMEEQVKDLHAAESDLRKVISELDELMDKEFRATFETVAAEFEVIFTRLFNGGSAKLVLTDEEDMVASGIDIEARLPGKRAQRLALLSGGERSLTAAALVFALLKASPTPFCVMDEVDAMLDEANVGRFTELLKELSQSTQFVVITHNRNTVQISDVIYGITMGRDTASQVISLKLDEVGEQYTR